MRIMIVLMNIIRMAMILILICFAYRMIIIMKLAHDETMMTMMFTMMVVLVIMMTVRVMTIQAGM